MAIIDRSRLCSDMVSTVPYTWALFTECIRAADGRRLVEEFPSDRLLLRASTERSDKTYTVRSSTVCQGGRLTGPALPEVWGQLVDEVRSAEFAATVGKLSGQTTRPDACEIRLTEYGQGFSMSAHTDRADKLVTLVFYLGLDWRPGDGGELTVLRSQDERDIYARIAPTLGSCAMLARSPSSWHRVEAPTRPGARRQALLIHFHTPGASI